ncbi:unnamed protein product [marine sediment metagenome]|uniref:Uncharacterized protein n=2 Tax=marine sediment metagenome TaxID=412755 RepID=X1Q5V2_9ZZZZ
MSWKEKSKEFGGGDLAFLSEDGEVINFVVVGEPVLLEGKFKGRPTEKVGCPIVTEDGFVLLVAGKRLFRKIAKHEERFGDCVFQAIRHGEQGDINSTYDLKMLDDNELARKLFTVKAEWFNPEMIDEAVKAALDVMTQ